MCKWKMCEHIILFKNWKLLFKYIYQMAPNCVSFTLDLGPVDAYIHRGH